ncbi:putative protein serine/threonine kinase [Heterostelium album PN500]|uniref:Serine/threonine-protein kinase RIO1 n=1 Tax=Heterostelium pallidum (strain ATCC 26659 / Pp 5 / PN500) TaxID=670386 RepID=D3BFF5_HETP5|nr:putative protein serine/threonine kinase [Heterostelium album PN500]EFA79869.1 putative protein serine/threonine kinase [Heterostelium album PN500]|eukprot:XP_020431990.1 putative protein serine/threonine kinase [Heterostelium album PN500]
MGKKDKGKVSQTPQKSKYFVAVMGSGSVGKSALTVQFTQGIFIDKYDPTVEDTYTKSFELDGENVCIEVLDTAGSEVLVAMRELYMKSAEGFVLVYNIVEQLFRVKEEEEVPIVLVGNKIDLDSHREVSTNEGKQLSQSYPNCEFWETSCKDRINVDNVFYSIVRKIRDKYKKEGVPTKEKKERFINMEGSNITLNGDNTIQNISNANINTSSKADSNTNNTNNNNNNEEYYDDDYYSDDDYSDDDYFDSDEDEDRVLHERSSLSLNKSLQPRNNVLEQKYQNKINLGQMRRVIDDDSHRSLPNSVSNEVREIKKKDDKQGIRIADKENRATTEQVLDPRTRLMLFKMINKGVISEINGCVSTGKEANVYHAMTAGGEERAIKVYKTSILVFKDRDRYVTGEFRFRRGYSKHNPRKMVKVWAEKEYRNLMRLKSAGIPCPTPLVLRNHILIMNFIGKDGYAAPRLKDAVLTDERYHELYLDAIKMMRTLYHKCRLVHADLSEYNILYYKGGLFIIDVSQSVEHDHPHSLEFLRMDVSNITDFFRKNGVQTMLTQELFEFVTDISINDDNIDLYLDAKKIVDRGDLTEEDKIKEEVFRNAYIPRTLDQILDLDRDLAKAKAGGDVFYNTIMGLSSSLTTTLDAPEMIKKDSNDDDDDEEDSEDDDSEDEDEDDESDSDSNEVVSGILDKDGKPIKLEDMPKKERKKLVKELNRERRKTKIPKHIKKQTKKKKAEKFGKKK